MDWIFFENVVAAKDVSVVDIWKDLFKKKKYSEIIFEISSKTKEEDRNAGLFVLLGISRISLNKKNKDQKHLQ